MISGSQVQGLQLSKRCLASADAVDGLSLSPRCVQAVRPGGVSGRPVKQAGRCSCWRWQVPGTASEPAGKTVTFPLIHGLYARETRMQTLRDGGGAAADPGWEDRLSNDKSIALGHEEKGVPWYEIGGVISRSPCRNDHLNRLSTLTSWTNIH